MKWKTVDGLLRADAVRYGDLLETMRGYTGDRKVKWINRRAALLRQPLRARAEGNFASGRPRYRIDQDPLGRSWYVNTPNRLYLYQNGIAHRAIDLAHSYALQHVEFRPGDVVIDCGANYGDLGLYFHVMDAPVPVRYLAVEPGEEEAECISLNLPGAEAETFAMALGREDSRATFFYAPDSTGGRSALSPWPDETIVEKYDVTVTTLDSLVDGALAEGERIRVLKLEAEGAEFDVLTGARRALDRCDYIAIDMGRKYSIEEVIPAPRLIPMLLDAGFAIEAVGAPCSLRFLFRNTRA